MSLSPLRPFPKSRETRDASRRRPGSTSGTRIGILILTFAFILVACSQQTYSRQEIAGALESLRPSDLGVTWGQWMIDCAKEAGFEGELRVDPLGDLHSSPENDREEKIVDMCAREAEELFKGSDVYDDRLRRIALYQLQVRAAECVSTELNLDPQLPSLSEYLAMDANWNMYDELTPADYEEWIDWNEICPQDLWSYYTPDMEISTHE